MLETSPRGIRWLVVGHGRAARCHIAAIGLAQNAHLVGIVARGAPDVTQVPWFKDLGEAISESRPDAVVIATSHDHHQLAAATALSAGVPVLCEKPVGRNAEEAATMLRMSIDSGTPVGVVLNQRACRHHEWIRERIAAGEFHCRSANFTVTVPRLSGWNAAQARAGGGVLRTVGLHYLDLLCWWFGRPTWFSASMAGNPVDDITQLLLRFDTGTQASLSVTAVGDRFFSPPLALLQADTARIQLRGHGITEVYGLPEPPPLEPTPEGLLFGPGHLAVIQSATDRLLSDKRFPLELSAAMPTLTLLDEIYAGTRATGSFCTNR